MEYWPLIVSLLIAGAASGLIAGLFGVGGGIVMVPVLFYVLSSLGYPDTAMHAAVGTSLAVIVVNSLRSVSEHAKKGAVDFQVLKAWTPWIVVGALAGSAIADLAPGRALTGLFGAVALILSAQFFFGRPDWKLSEDMPGQPWRAMLASFIGIMSALMGIGGGVFGVTLMTVCGRTIHQAVATAAGFGVAIGAPAALGFMIAGADEVGRAPFSIGYVNMAAFAVLASTALFVTPLGAKLAHTLNATRLKQVFAVVLAVLALNMLREAVFA